jgi:dipeptidyl aminopeptidase/acylaminoacyl peptidase
VNIFTGKTDLIFKNTKKYVGIDFDHDLTLRIAHKIEQNGDGNVYLIKDGKEELFKKIPFEDMKTSAFSHFSADNKTLYSLESLNRDKLALFAYNLEDKTSKMLFESKVADIGGFLEDPESFAPQCVSVEYLKPEIFVIDKKIAKDIKFLENYKSAEGKYLCKVQRSDDDKIWLVAYCDTTSLPQYYLCKRDEAGKILPPTRLFYRATELEKYKLQKKEPVVIKSRDGLNLVCYLTKAADFEVNTPKKMVVLVHGGPWARDCYSFDKEVQLLANRGYSVLQINYRGSSGFGKGFVNAADGHLDKIRNDIIDGVNWAITNRIADKEYVAIMGASFGGFSALAGLAFTPEVFCCGVDCVGVSSLGTFWKKVPPYWTPSMIVWVKLAGDPRTEEGRKALEKNSPIAKVNDINKPLIVFHGKNDPRVNKAEADQIVKALKKKGLPVAYILYPDEGHGFHKEQNSKSYTAFTEIFLAKILGGKFEPIHAGELKGSSHKILEGKELLGLK